VAARLVWGGRGYFMLKRNYVSLLILLFIISPTSWRDLDRIAKVEPKRLSAAELSGRVFREQVLQQWKIRPAEFFLEMDGLCRENFLGKSLHEANLMMRGAGQAFDLAKSSQAAALIPPGTTPYAGGLGLHASLISGASFNIMFYAAIAGAPERLVVKDVTCGIRQVSL
jgi:hypothetical protein